MPKTTRNVKLLSHTPNVEQAIAMAARICYSDADLTALGLSIDGEKAGGFVRKLRELGHLSTFEHAAFTFGIEGVSRAMLAQITRHRIASFSVQSQRYVFQAGNDGFSYIIPPSIEALGEAAAEEFRTQMDTIEGFYKGWVDKLGGKSESANEDARFVLPNACETKMMFTLNARELLHFFNLRCCNRAQWEIRDVAWDMLELVTRIAPNVFDKAGPACIGGACGEGKMTCGRKADVIKRRDDMMRKIDDGDNNDT